MKTSFNLLLNLMLLCCLLYITGGCNNDKGKSSGPSQDSINTVKSPSTDFSTPGGIIYAQNCLTCHQASGAGVANMNPPLQNSEYVQGDKIRLISIVLHGSNQGLLVNGKTYSNAMPAHSFLTDQQVADVLNFVRNNFGNKADSVKVSEIASVRKKT